MTPDDMVVVDLNGNRVEGNLNPSSDTATHLELYKAFSALGGIVHTHSANACAWAQAGRDIPVYGTTHADFANGPVPCTRALSREEVVGEYEKNTGIVIVRTFKNRNIDPVACPAVLVKCHGPFTWGKDPFKAVENALILEEVAKMAEHTEQVAQRGGEKLGIEDYLLKKHYDRKHGANAYYGQQ